MLEDKRSDYIAKSKLETLTEEYIFSQQCELSRLEWLTTLTNQAKRCDNEVTLKNLLEVMEYLIDDFIQGTNREIFLLNDSLTDIKKGVTE